MASEPGEEATVTAEEPQRSWRYGELTRDHVVQAALEIVLRDGLGGLSMRKLADELGISSMNAYYHVPNKQALLDLVGDAVIGQVPDPPDGLAWDEQVRSFFEQGRQVLLRYPGVANQARLYRVLTGLLTEAGFTRQASDQAQRVLAYLLFGAVTSERATADAAEGSVALSFASDDDVFRFGLDLMIEGLRALPHAGRPPT
jgi:TetR/AcrR family tetracycline transcriptional repressor